jgi:peptide-methionine (R)-S-oxide reductase
MSYFSEEEWKRRLSPACYRVCRQKGTEPPFHNEYWDCQDSGTYQCVACGQDLFRSEDKFDSGTGWPSFTRPIDNQCTDTVTDRSLREERVEVICSRCKSHLGHVFEDGPPPTGKRFCMNSIALQLVRS